MTSQKYIFGHYPTNHMISITKLDTNDRMFCKRGSDHYSTPQLRNSTLTSVQIYIHSYNFQVVILVLLFIHFCCGIYCLKVDQGLKFKANLWVCPKVELLIRVLLSVDKVLGCVLVCALQLATQLPYPENGSLHCNSICQSGHSQGRLALSLTPAHESCLVAMPSPST